MAHAATQELFDSDWLNNSLLDDGFLRQKQRELADQSLPEGLLDWLEHHFDPARLAAGNESQLEASFIAPWLQQLGWFTLPQQVLTVQGKQAKPDWCLLSRPEQAPALIEQASAGHRLITAICEAKAWDKPLDTGKANQDNPHHQLQDYLSRLRVRFGFLTNGRQWRVYDTDKISAKKSFIEFDLERLLALTDPQQRRQALALFVFFLRRDTYAASDAAGQSSAIERTLAEAGAFALEVEDNLKAVIYGYDGEASLFEIMGQAIQRANARHQVGLDAVYENSVILLFRLLFVVYFEDRNRELLARHPFYPQYGLQALYARLRQTLPERGHLHDGVFALKQLFEMLDRGAEDIDIPLFNGGLFDPARAPLLLTPKLFDNATLLSMLEKLLFKTRRGATLFDTRRDFRNMSVTHLGRIYEGLLEFRFERALEPATYLEYETLATRGKRIEAYFDAYDAASVRRQKGFKALREFSVKPGDVYLKSANNSRKTSASYYTPASLSERLVKAGIDQALAQGRALAELKILDNACGSGHFLVQALDYLTDLALASLERDAELAQLVRDERAKIAAQLDALSLPYEPDDAQILKRVLLKRCIYGVDLNLFAVELARLSLWMDSFIFGTPLSFIEHHVQHGNALIGATVQDFIDYNARESQQNDLFVDDLRGRFDELRGVMQELDAMRDTTPAEVAQSKRLWHSVAPRLRLLGRALGFISTRRVLQAEGRSEAVRALDKTPNLIDELFNEDRRRASPVVQQIEDCAARYRFFHYEVAFPEAFASERRGFDVIVGNPPWDKTKFSDTDFFPQYHSNYRSLKNSEKAAVRERLLGSPHIAAAYAQAQRDMEVVNDYCKAAYPLNRGAGDGNLFRFFVERNLGLLAPGGSLNYVLPSALMFEEGSLALRREILNGYRLPFFHSFENNRGIFPEVHRSYKFALMQVVNAPPDEGAVIDTAFYLLDAAELDDPGRHVPYPLAALKTLSPAQWALMELRDATDLPLLAKCYAAFPPLCADWLDFRAELHMTSDKDLFLEQARPGCLPLYQGRMIWQYSHCHAEPEYWLDPAAFDQRLRSKELYRMGQDLGLPKALAYAHSDAIRYDRDYVRLGFREIARDTDERTLIFALLPRHVGAGNKVPVNVPKRYQRADDGRVRAQAVSPLRLLFALACFNSLTLDWMARFMIQITVNQTYLYRLPMPQPDDEAILQDPDYRALARNALRLTLAAGWDDFAADLAPQLAALDVTRQDVPTTPKALDKLRADTDRRVARLYGLGAADFAHLLQSFKGMASKRPEYLTLLQAAPA